MFDHVDGLVMRIPDEVQKLWSDRLERLVAQRGELALPNASTAALVIAGGYPDRETVKAIQMLSQQAPGEVPLDAAEAKCRKLDSSLYDEYRKAMGVRPRGSRVLEAVLVSTDASAVYVAPNLELAWRWPWETVAELNPIRRGRRFSRVELSNHDGDRYKISLGTRAMENLLTVYDWVTGRADARGGSSPPRN